MNSSKYDLKQVIAEVDTFRKAEQFLASQTSAQKAALEAQTELKEQILTSSQSVQNFHSKIPLM